MMMTVKEVSKLSGVSIRTLQYYDRLGLLPPAGRTEAGYRLYDDTVLERLWQILLFRELEFPLADIRTILDDPALDRKKVLTQQIDLLTMKKQRLERIIDLAREIRDKGEIKMEFKVFDDSEIKEYEKSAKAQWGSTREYKEYSEKHGDRSTKETREVMDRFMGIFAEFGAMKDKPAGSPEVQAQTAKLREFISANYYECSAEMLASLGQMYASDGRFRANIDKAGGEGTAEFVNRAIAEYCRKKI